MNKHIVTDFSLGHSLIGLDDVRKIAEENKNELMLVCDNMSINSMIPLSDAENCVFGVRLSLVDVAEQQRSKVYKIKVFPKNDSGQRLLYKYLSRSFERPYFYEQPRLDFTSFYEMLETQPDAFYVFTGDFDNIFTNPLASKILDRVMMIVGDDNLIVEVIPAKTAYFDRLNLTALDYAKSRAVKVDTHIPIIYTEENASAFPIHYSINKNVEFNFLSPYYEGFFCKTKEQVLDEYKSFQERTEAHSSFKNVCFERRHFYKWNKKSALIPQLSPNSGQALKDLALKGFKERLTKPLFGFQPSIDDLKTVYIDRLKYELKTLIDLKFEDYFLVVHEVVNWCKRQGIVVGPGRGSAGGSLVSFCLGITDIDPVRFNLIFERFINPTRLDLPDIDLDFMSTRRTEIIDHLKDRYGTDKVAGIVNYAYLQSKSSLRSTCRIMGLPEEEYSCSKLIPAQFGFTASLEDARMTVVEIHNFASKHQQAWKTALQLEGKMRNYSTHAAGVIISSESIADHAVLEQRSGAVAINWDKSVCEKQGLIKVDVLGLTTLDVFDLTLQYIREKGININLEDIPLDDKKVMLNFELGLTAGIFQFDGGSVKKLLRSLAKSSAITFDDLIAANALNRPGPIESGLVQDYIDGKNGDLKQLPHPSIKECLENTYNVICYQEQIMKVVQIIGGFSSEMADDTRKNMGKKEPEKLKLKRDLFIKGTTGGVILASLDDGNKVYMQKNAKYKVEEGGFFTYKEISANDYTVITPLVME